MAWLGAGVGTISGERWSAGAVWGQGLMTNGRFDADLSGWSVTDPSSSTWQAGLGPDGSGCLRTIGDGAGSEEVSQTIAVVEGVTYRLRGKLWGDAADVAIQSFWFDSGMGFLSTAQLATSAGGSSWEDVDVDITAPAGAAFLRVDCRMGATTSEGRWDDLSLAVEASSWEDATSWPLAYDPDAALTLNVYIEGVDHTALARSLSWGLGQSDLWSGVTVSSAALTFADGAVAANGDRVVILTEYDVLWVGAVEAVSEDVELELTTIGVSCVDDLSRASNDRVSRRLGGHVASLIGTVLQHAGVHLPVTARNAIYQGGLPILAHATVDSAAALGLVNEMADAMNVAVAASPAGVAIYPRTYRAHGVDWDGLLFGDASSRKVSRDVKDVRNVFVIEGAETARDDESVTAYGPRVLEVDYSDTWWVPASPANASRYSLVADALAQPPRRLLARVPIVDGADQLHRAVPLDVASDTSPDARDWLLTRTQHDVDVETWSLGLEGVEVVLAPLLAHALAQEGLLDVWSWSSPASWVGANGTIVPMYLATEAAAIIPSEDAYGSVAGEDLGVVVSPSLPDIGDEWSWSGWFQDGLADTVTLLWLYGTTLGAGVRSVRVQVSTAGAITVSELLAPTTMFQSAAGVVSADTPTHIVVRHDAAGATTVYVNGSAVTPSASNSDAYSQLRILTMHLGSSALGMDGPDYRQLPALYAAVLPDGFAAAHYTLGTT